MKIEIEIVRADDLADEVARWESPTATMQVGDVISLEGQPNLRIVDRVWYGPFRLMLVVAPCEMRTE